MQFARLLPLLLGSFFICASASRNCALTLVYLMPGQLICEPQCYAAGRPNNLQRICRRATVRGYQHLCLGSCCRSGALCLRTFFV